jgi:hypothetical protein
MIINQNRGSHGMFSRAGRSSTEKFHILIKKDDIIKGAGLAKSQLQRKEINSDESDIDIFEGNTKDGFFNKNLKFNNKKAKIKFKINKEKKNIEEKFKDIIEKNKQLNINPSFNKYNPKRDFIYKKIVNDFDFSKTVKKNFTIKPKEEIRSKYYIDIDFEGKNIQGKNSIELSKQTNRLGFVSEFCINNNRKCDKKNNGKNNIINL